VSDPKVQELEARIKQLEDQIKGLEKMILVHVAKPHLPARDVRMNTTYGL
jgi:hypothetical protein